MINIYQLQNLAPISLIIGLYLGITAKNLISLMIIFAIFYKKTPEKIRRIIMFFLIGCGRGLIEKVDESYSYKYTSFEAKIIDYQIRENKDYLLLTDFKYKPVNSSEYKLDIFAKFPKEALMEVENIGEYKNAKKVCCIGRFYIPMPILKPGTRRIGKPRGIIKRCRILEVKKSSFKHYLREKFKRYLNEEVSRFCCAIFLSDTFAIPKEMRKIYESAGLAHILGISILNLGIILMFLFYVIYYLIGIFYLRSTDYLPLYVSAQIGSICSIVFYCYLVGFEYPLLRTLFMSLISILMLCWGNRHNVESLLLSACLILLIDPLAIYDLSFQLSFGGVLGIYAFSNIKFKNKIVSSIWTTISAMALIGPISIYQFQQMCFQPFLSNLIVIPTLSFCIIPSLLAYIVMPDFLCKYFAILINFEFRIFQKLIIFLSKTAQNIHFLPIFYAFFIVFLAFFLMFSIIKEKIRYYFLGAGYLVLVLGIIRSYKGNSFILVNISSIGLVLKDKIVVYPKSGVIGEIWSEYYNLPAIDGANTGYFKNDCGKIVVQGVGIVRSAAKGNYCLNTKKDYVFLPCEIMEETKIIEL